MEAEYDYVQVVVDDDWGLVSIIPHNDGEKKITSEAQKKTILTHLSDENSSKTPVATVLNASSNRGSHDNVNIKDGQKVSNPNALSGMESINDIYSSVTFSRSLNPSYGFGQNVEFGNLSGRAVAYGEDAILVGFGK